MRPEWSLSGGGGGRGGGGGGPEIESSSSANASAASTSSSSSPSPSGKRSRDPEDEVYLDNFHSHKRYLSEIMASSLNGLTVGDPLPLPDNLMESPARSDTLFYPRSADFGSKLRTAQNELENEPYMLGKLRMSIFWSTSRIVNIIFLEEVMAVLTLKGFQDAEQFVTALKAINPIKLAAKTDAAKNKSADTYSNIR